MFKLGCRQMTTHLCENKIVLIPPNSGALCSATCPGQVCQVTFENRKPKTKGCEGNITLTGHIVPQPR